MLIKAHIVRKTRPSKPYHENNSVANRVKDTFDFISCNFTIIFDYLLAQV